MHHPAAVAQDRGARQVDITIRHAGVRRHHLQDGRTQTGLAAPAFAHNTQAVASLQRKRNTIHRSDGIGAQIVGHAQVRDAQDRRIWLGYCWHQLACRLLGRACCQPTQLRVECFVQAIAQKVESRHQKQ